MATRDPPKLEAEERVSGVSLTAVQSEPCWDCDAPGEVAVLKSESSDTE